MLPPLDYTFAKQVWYTGKNNPAYCRENAFTYQLLQRGFQQYNAYSRAYGKVYWQGAGQHCPARKKANQEKWRP